MILNGHIDNQNKLWIKLKVAGDHNQQEISAIIDTGFTGELLLPIQVAVPLGLKLAGVAPYRLADGSISRQMLFYASVVWGTTTRLVTVNVVDTDDDALVGGGLLHGYTLLVDFEKKLLIIKEPHTDEPTIEKS